MTTRQASSTPQTEVAGFVDRPKRENLQNVRYLHRPGLITALSRYLGNPDTTLVFGEIPVDWRPRQRSGQLYPDMIVAFDIDVRFVMAERGYAIEIMGKPPDFVLEVASRRTARNDYTRKRERYAEFGIPEYWRFDSTGGSYYPAPLAGDRLVDGEYRPIPIVKVDDERYRGHSDALNLDLCWEYGELRLYDPVAQRYVETHDDVINARDAAEAQRDAAQAQRDAAQAQRDAAQAQRDAAEARVRQLEEKLGYQFGAPDAP